MPVIKKELKDFLETNPKNVDYNYLMGIVEIIENISLGMDNSFNVEIGGCNFCRIYTAEITPIFKEIVGGGTNKVNIIHDACFKFIEWYQKHLNTRKDAYILFDIIKDNGFNDIELNLGNPEFFNNDIGIQRQDYLNYIYAEFIIAGIYIRKNNYESHRADKNINYDWVEIVSELYDLALFFTKFSECFVSDYNGHLESVIHIYLDFKNECDSLSVLY